MKFIVKNGVIYVSGRTPEKVKCYRYECDKCGVSTTVPAMNPKEPVRGLVLWTLGCSVRGTNDEAGLADPAAG